MYLLLMHKTLVVFSKVAVYTTKRNVIRRRSKIKPSNYNKQLIISLGEKTHGHYMSLPFRELIYPLIFLFQRCDILVPLRTLPTWNNMQRWTKIPPYILSTTETSWLEVLSVQWTHIPNYLALDHRCWWSVSYLELKKWNFRAWKALATIIDTHLFIQKRFWNDNDHQQS